MRAVLQRVLWARVSVGAGSSCGENDGHQTMLGPVDADPKMVGAIGPGGTGTHAGSDILAEASPKIVGAIGPGLMVLLGVGEGDSDSDAAWLADKISNLRIFEDDAGKMNLSLIDTGGSILAVSQFTLYGDCRRGRRPSFSQAAKPEVGYRLYDEFVLRLREKGIKVETGQFGANMQVELCNDGPVTLILDTLV